MSMTREIEMAELVIAKNRSGEMGVINLRFSGDSVKFSETGASLAEYAQEATPRVHPRSGETDWDRVNETVGSYNPFENFERGEAF